MAPEQLPSLPGQQELAALSHSQRHARNESRPLNSKRRLQRKKPRRRSNRGVNVDLYRWEGATVYKRHGEVKPAPFFITVANIDGEWKLMTSFVPRARHSHHSASCFETPSSPASLRKSLKGEDVEPGANNRVRALEQAALSRSTRRYCGGVPQGCFLS